MREGDSGEEKLKIKEETTMQKLTLLPRAENNYRTQEEAITFHNQRGEPMCSVADALALEGQDIGSIRIDFNGVFMSSSRFDYNPKDLSGTLTHNFGSTIVKPTVFKLKEIPVCRPTYFKELVKTDAGLELARAFAKKPKATKEQLEKAFVSLSGKKIEDIRFWTPTPEQRISKPVRPVRLCFIYGRLDVFGDYWFNDNGLSRGMTLGICQTTNDHETTQRNLSEDV